MTAFDVKWEDLDIGGKHGLILGSGVDRTFMVATRNNDRIKASPDAGYIEEFIKDNEIRLPSSIRLSRCIPRMKTTTSK